jgi:DNA primase
MYYDIEKNGIVLPLYHDNYFCGAQTRFIKPIVHSDGEIQKMDTMPGTRLGLLTYAWNGKRFVGNVKAVVICEGAFNSLSLQQALNHKYGGIANNPWRCLATSGCNLTAYHKEIFKELKEQGMKVVCAYDFDEAGLAGLKKAIDSDCITHSALTNDDDDWNSLLQKNGHEWLADFFISTIKKI